MWISWYKRCGLREGGGGWSQMRLCGNNLRLKLIEREHVDREGDTCVV